MHSKTFDLNTHNIAGAMLKLGLPAVLTALFDEINGVIDTIFMGHFIGAEAVASMSIVMPFLIFDSALSLLFGDGAVISMGRYLGAKDFEKSSKIASLTVKSILLSSIVFGVLSFLFAPLFLKYFNLEQQTYIYALKYIRYFSLGLPVFMYSMLMLKILYTEGFSKTTLKLTILQVGANIGLNYIFLGVFNWGLEGAVAGTLLSFLLQGILATKALKKKNSKTKINIKTKFDKAYVKEVIPLGMPAFFTMVLLAVTMAIQGKVIAGYGSSALGVATIFGNIFSVSSSVATGIINAALVLMSYSVGAGNKQRFSEILKKSALIIFITSAAISLPLIFAPEAIGAFFTDSEAVIKLFIVPAFILGITSPFIFTTNILLFAMQPIGLEKTAALVFVLQQLGLYLPIIFFLKDMGFAYAMAAQPSAEVIGGVITLMLIPKLKKAVLKCFGKNTNGNKTPIQQE